jgi:hypothetical protein
MTIIGIIFVVDLLLAIPTMFLGGYGMIIRFLSASATLVFMVLGLIQLKLSNKDLQSKELNLFFYLKLIAISASTFIGVISDFLYESFLQSFIDAIQSGGGIKEFLQLISGSLLLSLIGWGILIIDIVAWGKLVEFFDQDSSFLNEVTRYKARDSAKNLKIASILNVLSFLVITVLVGFIFTLKGYFNLGKTLKSSTPAEVTKKPLLDDVPSKPAKFCSKCGTVLGEGSSFCPNCGVTQPT